MVLRGSTKRAVGVWVALALFAINFSPRVQSLRALPDILYLGEGQSEILDFLLPLKAKVEGDAVDVVRGSDQTLADVGATIQSQSPGTSSVTFSFLGIPVKEVQVQVTSGKRLIPGGQAIGIAMMTNGVYVAGTEAVIAQDGTSVNPARKAGIFPGDTILSANGVLLSSFEGLRSAVERCAGEPLALRVGRDAQEKTVSIEPVMDQSGAYRLGIWARDSTAGVGTLTYVDPEEGRYGALGHAVTDSDTGGMLSVREGSVFPSAIVGVQPGTQGKPGELRGVFSTDISALCTIDKNTDYGIYGNVKSSPDDVLYPSGLPVGMQSTVVEGPAQLLTTIDDGGVRAYDCRIVKVSRQTAPATRSLVVEVTDPELLERTGGIVQGMSGSPILQNGHIIGAVTHVYVNDPTRGYGLFIEWMLKAQEK